jgi:hypothetical protein
MAGPHMHSHRRAKREERREGNLKLENASEGRISRSGKYYDTPM